MIFIVHKDGRGFTSALTPREADAFCEMNGIPDSHIFFYHPDNNPYVDIRNGVYHYKGNSLNLENDND